MSRYSGFRRGGTASRRRRGTAALSITAIAVLLAACSASAPAAVSDDADWGTIVEAANAEGAVTVYSSSADSDRILKAFEQSHPEITTTIQRQPTADLFGQLDQEIAAGVAGADVTLHTQVPWFPQRAEEGVLAPIVVGDEADPSYADWEGETNIPVLRYSFAFGYNTESGEPVSTLPELADAAQRPGGTIGYLDPGASIAVASQYDAWNEAYPRVWDELSELPSAVFASSTPMGQALASGELAYVVGLVPGVIPPLREQGAPVDELPVSDDFAYGAQSSAAVLANAPHPNAAQVFINWVMSEELQGIFAEEQYPMTSFVVPQGDITFDSITLYDPADWPQSRVDEFQAWFTRLLVN